MKKISLILIFSCFFTSLFCIEHVERFSVSSLYPSDTWIGYEDSSRPVWADYQDAFRPHALSNYDQPTLWRHPVRNGPLYSGDGGYYIPHKFELPYAILRPNTQLPCDPLTEYRLNTVYHRCMVINFLSYENHYAGPPSTLPEHFKEEFKDTVCHWWFALKERDYREKMHDEMHAHKDACNDREVCKKYERASMRQWSHYGNPGYRQFITGLSVYSDYILEIAAQLKHDTEFAQCLSVYKEATEYIQQESARIIALNKCRKEEELRRAAEQVAAYNHAQEQAAQQFVRDTWTAQADQLSCIERDAHEWRDIMAHHANSTCDHRFEKRIETIRTIQDAGISYSTINYQLSSDVRTTLAQAQLAPTAFLSCYGNQLQQVVHQDCIDIIERSAQEIVKKSIHDKSIICTLADAACDFNKQGYTHKAVKINDLCWTLLDYGKAAGEGAFWGVVGAVRDVVTHPVETAIAVVAGDFVIAFQAAKVSFNLTDIGLTYAFIDYQEGKDKWYAYTEPLNNFITALRNREITLRDAIRGGVQGALHLETQRRLLNGLVNICANAKNSLADFIKNNPFALPEQYLATSEGLAAKGLHESSTKLLNPAHDINQYEKLKVALQIEEFTSIIGVTKHGVQRLIERGFTPEDVIKTVKHPTYVTSQLDGATVYVKKIENKFNVIILNEYEKKVVTAVKNVDHRDLINLGKRYQWK